jgi:hypothetical protein
VGNIDVEKMLWGNPPIYIAISKYGYGISKCPAKAIRRAQEHVPLDDKPSQLLLYAAAVVWDDEISDLHPKAFRDGAPVWGNDSKPKLVGLTNTHQGWRRRQ